jgi:hypothetical protein
VRLPFDDRDHGSVLNAVGKLLGRLGNAKQFVVPPHSDSSVVPSGAQA